MSTAPSRSDDVPSRTLARRPRAEARSVESLVQDLLDGQVRIPGWQRKIRWDVSDARELLDSLYRGYPVGTLLLWKRHAPAERIDLGTVRVVAAERADALYVVDGQQRLTSMVRALAGAGVPDESFALFFDLARREIVTPPRGGGTDPLLPMTEVLDSRRLVKWLIEHPAADRDAAIELGQRIREFAVPLYIVESDDERAVRDIFERTNDRRKRLDANEVFDGRFRGLVGAAPAGVRDVARRIAERGFGEIEEGELHTMMLALRFTDPTQADTSAWSSVDAHQALTDLQAAAERVLQFLVEDAGIAQRSLLPYAQPMLTLSRFFHFFPAPHPWNRRLLARWLWRGAVAGLHGGATVGTRATLQAIQTDPSVAAEAREDETVQALIALVEEGRGVPFDPSAERFNSKWASGRICTLALVAQGPLHLVSGEPLAFDALAPRQISTSTALKSSVGNRILHPPVKGGLLAAIQRCSNEAALASHFISASAHADAQVGVDALVRARESTIAAAVNALVKRRAAWDERDRPPLRALWDDDGDG